MSNNIYNILGKLKSITDSAALTPDTQPTTVYESVEARGSITEAVRALEAKYKTFKESTSSIGDTVECPNGITGKIIADLGNKWLVKDLHAETDDDELEFNKSDCLTESVADDIADKKAEKEAGDWWGDKKADSKKSREVKGDKYGGSKQKSDDEDDFKSKKPAILDKDDDEVLDEGFASPAQEAKIRARLEKLHDSGKYEPEVVYEKVAYEFGMTQKQLQDALAGKSLNEYSQSEYDGAMSDFKKKGGQVKQLPAGNAKNPISTASRHIAGKGEAGKGKTAGRGANVTASKPVVDVAEAFEFDSKNFKNASNLKKAPKAKLVKESASVRNHPIYTNPDAWNHYKQELDEEELNKATQELDEISKLAGLPKQINVDMSKDTSTPAPAKLDPSFPPAPPELPPLVIEADSAVSIRGRSVNVDSIEIDGVDTSDYPDFSDAYITYAEFTDGTPLSEFELDELYNEHGDLVNQAAHDSLQGMSDGYDPYDLEESTLGADFNKILNAIAALHGDEIWDNDAMQDLADELAQANPTDQELDYIIQNGDLPSRLANIQFSAGDNVQFNEAGVGAGKKYTVKEDINVNVTASGEEDALNLFRKLAGIPMIAIAQQEEMSDDTAMEIEVDEERDPKYVNSPCEQTAGIGAAIPSGNDLHGAKRAYKITQPGDNPMAVTESKKDTSWNKYTGMLKGLLK